MNENLNRWIKDNHLSVKFITDNILEVEEFGKFLIVSEKELTFDDRFILCLSDDEIEVLDTDVDYLLFKFGSFWFYHHKDSETELNFFRNLGKANSTILNIPFLGVHGKYELCNGSRDYNDWVKKAKFLGYKSIGICENQTLAGSFYFQQACDKEGIKAIHGRTNKVKSASGTFYSVKSYVKNIDGWKDLLKIHNIEIIKRTTSGKYITEDELASLSSNLFNVICHETDLDLVDLSQYDLQNTFFQFNIVEYKNNNKDKEHLLNLNKYLDKYLDKISPVVLQDAYYIDKGDDIVKPILNKISNLTTQFASEDEYLKPFDDVIGGLYKLFNSQDKLDKVITSTFSFYERVENECNFVLKKEGRHLPKYIMNDDEKLLYSSNEDMFFSLIEKGFKEKIIGKVSNEDEYFERIQREIEVLKEGDVLDYFLILYDIYNFLRKHCGIGSLGRGSAAGALTSYLLGIVQIDPIKHGLLFERFLTEGRLGIKRIKKTKLNDKVKSVEPFELILENGEKMILDSSSKLIVKRGDDEVEILVSELKEDDEIILS